MIDYKLLHSNDLGILADLIKAYLNDGYALSGEMTQDKFGALVQAVIKCPLEKP